jgi:hypothetical protein
MLQGLEQAAQRVVWHKLCGNIISSRWRYSAMLCHPRLKRRPLTESSVLLQDDMPLLPLSPAGSHWSRAWPAVPSTPHSDLLLGLLQGSDRVPQPQLLSPGLLLMLAP